MFLNILSNSGLNIFETFLKVFEVSYSNKATKSEKFNLTLKTLERRALFVFCSLFN